MDQSDPGRNAGWVLTGLLAKGFVLIAFAVVAFMAGRLWALREVQEAQRAAGLAEEGRIALQKELADCRNALVFIGERDKESPPR